MLLCFSKSTGKKSSLYNFPPRKGPQSILQLYAEGDDLLLTRSNFSTSMKCILFNYIAQRLLLTLKSQKLGRKPGDYWQKPTYERTYGFSRELLLSPRKMEKTLGRTSQKWGITDDNANLHGSGKSWLHSTWGESCWVDRWQHRWCVCIVCFQLMVTWFTTKEQYNVRIRKVMLQ